MIIHYIDTNSSLGYELEMILAPIIKSTNQIVIVTDKNVEKLYLGKLSQNLLRANVHVIVVEPGEQSKSREIKAHIETELIKFRCDRSTLMIAFGGGVIGDLTGFVAATYMRGIRYINIPTTLLAMVDSSIGGKTAINIPEGKNLIGAYWHPEKTIIDISLLSSLPKIHIINGLIESFKIFLTSDQNSLLKLENNVEKFLNIDYELQKWIIQTSISIKSELVKQDERETELRKILNFGHTVGHAIEKLSGYQLLHGVAVGYGILVESKIACLFNLLDPKDYQKIKAFLIKVGINSEVFSKYSADNLMHAMLLDKKNQSNEIYCVLLNGIGSVFQKNHRYAHPIKGKVIKNAIEAVKEGN